MNPVFLDINHEALLVGLVMPIGVACILALVAFIQVRRATKNGVNLVNDPALTRALLDALQAQAMATVNSSEAMKIFHEDIRTVINEGRAERQKVMEALTILLERSRV